jgi:hypothetical protein
VGGLVISDLGGLEDWIHRGERGERGEKTERRQREDREKK